MCSLHHCVHYTTNHVIRRRYRVEAGKPRDWDHHLCSHSKSRHTTRTIAIIACAFEERRLKQSTVESKGDLNVLGLLRSCKKNVSFFWIYLFVRDADYELDARKQFTSCTLQLPCPNQCHPSGQGHSPGTSKHRPKPQPRLGSLGLSLHRIVDGE